MAGGMLLTASVATAFASAYVLGGAAWEELRRVRSSVDAQAEGRGEALAGDGGASGLRKEARAVAGYYARNGVAWTKGASGWILKRPEARYLFEDMAKLAGKSGWDASAESLASVFVLAVIVLCAGAWIVLGSGFSAVMAPICMAAGVAVVVSQKKSKELEALRDQVPEALRCMEASLHAGVTLPQAFSEVAAELPSPTKELFARVSQDLDLGYSMNEALSRFHRQAELPELVFVAMALDVQYACGGSATPILRSAERSVSQGVNLKRSLRVQTAQARLSAQIVCVMPFALLFVLSAVSPGFLDPFFSGMEGFCLLAVALAMQALGVVLVKRGLDVGV